MNENKLKKKKKGRLGRPPKHGGYSLLVRGELAENRKHIKQYLTISRENLIRDLGPGEDNLTAAQIIIIDRVVSKLGVVRCIEEHIRENSVMRGHDLAPSLKASYLAYNNSVRLDLRELGIDKRMEDRVLTPLEIAEEFDKKKGAKEKAKK